MTVLSLYGWVFNCYVRWFWFLPCNGPSATNPNKLLLSWKRCKFLLATMCVMFSQQHAFIYAQLERWVVYLISPEHQRSCLSSSSFSIPRISLVSNSGLENDINLIFLHVANWEELFLLSCSKMCPISFDICITPILEETGDV